MKQKNVILALFILILAGSFIYLQINRPIEEDNLVNTNQSEEQIDLSAEALAKVDTSDWLTYRNEEYGFEFKYKENWNIEENNIITVVQENKDLGFVGKPTGINKEFLTEIIKANEVPVIAPLGVDKDNQTFNINADTTAGSIAIELKARRLMIISDVEGVLDSEKKLIPEINSKKANELIDQEVISGGMIPKIKNCLDVASNGVKAVVIIDGRKNHSLLFELLSDKGSGTLIRE